jgi:hypothetical protein
MRYEYDGEDRLAAPHHYMYSEYQGAEFVSTYYASRERAISSLAADGPAEWGDASAACLVAELRAHRTADAAGELALPPTPETLARTKALEALSADDAQPTALVLDALAGSLARDSREGGVSTAARMWTGRLVQRFEVTKRLYERYQPGFRRGEGSHEAPALYASLALGLAVGFQRTGKLPLLNCLMKLNDLLISIRDRYEGDSEVRAMVLEVLRSEIRYVADLQRRLGVSNETR